MSANDSHDKTLYDFGEGVRGKYSARLGGPDAPWVREMALRDTQRWAAEGLLRFQQLEGFFVAYFSLLLNRNLVEASEAAREAMHNPQSNSLKALLEDLSSGQNEDLARQLLELINQRNWFVHRSFHTWRFSPNPSEAVDRLSEVTSRLSQVDRAFYRHLLKRCTQAGISSNEAAAKTEQVIQEWAAA